MRTVRKIAMWAGAAAVLWVVKASLGLFVVNLLLVYVIVAVGLNLLMGFTGQISAGHAGFLAVGAYVAALVGTHAPQVGAVGALIAAGAAAALLGVAIGLPALRLAGFYIAMATLAFGVVVTEAILQMDVWTGGADGMYVLAPSLFGFPLDSDTQKFWLVLGTAVLAVWTAQNLAGSKVGRAFLALRESDVATETLGISTAAYRTLAFALSAFYTGVAGGLFAYVVSYISPDAFSIELSIDFVAMVILGGMGSIGGSIVGAALLTVLNQYLAVLQDFKALIFGLAVVVCMILMPGGVSAAWKAALERFRG